MPNDTTQIDPSIVALMHGLKTSEGTNGNYNAIGDNGTASGVGQWSNQINGKVQPLQKGQIPANFVGDAKQYGLDPTDFSPENQNKVIYAVLSQDKKDGLTPEQALSKWNSGDANKYQTAPTGSGQVGAYDVADYVKRGMTAAQAYAQSTNKGQPNSPASSVTPPTAPGQAPTQQPSQTSFGGALQPPTPPQATTQAPASTTPAPESFTGDLAGGNYGGAALKGAENVGNAIIGAPVSLGAHLAQGAAGLTADFAAKTGLLGGQAEADKIRTKLASPLTSVTGSTVSPLKSGLGGAEQIGGDALQTVLLAAGPETGAAKSVLGRLAANSALGAGFGIGGALSEGGTASDVGKGALTGSLVGGAVGGAGELLNKVANYLPERIARSFIPGINQDTAKYAVDKGLGTPEKMLSQSDASLSKVGSSIGTAIKGAVSDGAALPKGEDLFNTIAEQFPEAGLSGTDVAANLKKLVPLKSILVDKIMAGTASLEDLQNLNSALGKATFKTVFDDPTVKAGKEVGNAMYHEFGDLIKSYLSPEEGALYDEYSKESALNTALSKAVRRGQKGKMFTLRDLVAITGGFSAGSVLGMGPIGAGLGYAGEKALNSPGINMGIGGLLSKLARPTAQAIGAQAKAPLIGGTTSLLQRLSQGQ